MKKTPENIRRAVARFQAGATYKDIAREFGLSGCTMARIWVDPVYAEKRREQVRAMRRDTSEVIQGLEREENYQTARDAAKRLAQIPADTRDFTARFCGDPLPGRRAIDHKREMALRPGEVPFQ